MSCVRLAFFRDLLTHLERCDVDPDLELPNETEYRAMLNGLLENLSHAEFKFNAISKYATELKVGCCSYACF